MIPKSVRSLLLLAFPFAACLPLYAQPIRTIPTAVTPASGSNAERERINSERAKLESGFASEDAACYQNFFVNNCLDAVKVRRREAMADLRRQEISLNEQDRKIKAADQIRKTEEKSSPERQQQAADQRATALKDFQSRQDREKQKNVDRTAAQTKEKSSADAASARLRNSQQKAVSRTEKQGAAAENARKFRQRQDDARERQIRRERDKLNPDKPAASSLPVPP